MLNARGQNPMVNICTQVIIYGGIQQNGIILSVHTKTVNTSMKRWNMKKNYETVTNSLMVILGVFPGIPPEENQVVPMGWSRAMRSSEVLKSVHCILVSFTNPHAPSFHLSNCTHALQSLFKMKFYYISSKIFFSKDMKLGRFVMICCTVVQSGREEEDGESLV